MSSFNKHASQTAAKELLSAALSSGALKLRGPGHDKESNEANAKLDADYLNSVFSSIVNKITSE